MKRIIALVGSIVTAGALALPAAPAAAQSLSFGFGVDVGPGSYCYFNPWDCRRPYRRNGISIDLGGVDIDIRAPRLRGHIARCEARYKSYDRWTDTYITFSGKERRCRL